ncbi:MAG TPA: hypothetical protein VNS53_00755 [Sphingomicrobium sp.]|jgi:hypothetical protein|nr:hypothetical protein [Sphingomicrobium sp.]
MRTSSIFKSRWMAVLWAAGIIWFALDIAGGGKSAASASNNQASASTGLTDDDGQTVSDNDVETAANALGF